MLIDDLAVIVVSTNEARRAGRSLVQTWADFARIVRLYPRIHPLAWQFIAAQRGGRALRRASYRLTSVVAKLRRTW